MTNLYREQEGRIMLVAARCSVCETMMFPPQSYGCLSCGTAKDGLVEATIPAIGILQATATVHMHPTHPVPFTVGRIRIAHDIMLNALLTDEAGEPRVGEPVSARLDNAPSMSEDMTSGTLYFCADGGQQ